MIDWGKPIETTEGYSARVISTDYRDGAMTLVVVQAEFENGSFILRFSQDGTRMYHGTAIRNVKVKREGWVNIYARSSVHSTEEQAKANAGTDAKATIKIEWEE